MAKTRKPRPRSNSQLAVRRRPAKKSKEACRSYAIYREGANRANQSMTQSMIVDIVKACSRKEAVEEVSSTVQVYANQYLRAVPRSRVPADEWNSFLEEEATWK